MTLPLPSRVFTFSLPILLALLIVPAIPAQAAPGDGHWDRQFGAPGTGSVNYALRCNGNVVYTGGFNGFGGEVATNTDVSVYDGTNWSCLGEITGAAGALLWDFALLGSDLYVGGFFDAAAGVPAVGLAKWNGTSWSGVGGFEGVVLGLETDGTNLYVGGSFTNCGGVFATNIARWNGTNWSALGSGLGFYENSYAQAVSVMAWRDGQLYAGGSFTNAGAVAITNIARWDGNAWAPLGGGVQGIGSIVGAPVAALQFIGNDLYVGGNFSSVNGGSVSALNVAKWTGTTWSALGMGLKAPPLPGHAVRGLTAFGTDLYATGTFTNAGGISAQRFAEWNGISWSSPGSLNEFGTRVLSNCGSIYICGRFNIANQDTATNVIGNHIIRWDGAAWHSLPGKFAKGTHLFVNAVETGSDGLYVGGYFNAVGATVARRIARWDGTNWFALGSGVDGTYGGNTLMVRAIKARDDEIFVGGSFVLAGSVTANNIAKWDGVNWSALGYGVDSTVGAIEVTATDVYVGGSFTNAYNAPAAGFTVNRIARWRSGPGWSSLGVGVSGAVNAIRESGGLVYAGGAFTTAGGVAANRVAVWDGATWSSLGTGSANGVNGTVYAILADGADIYVGGSFTTAGGASAQAIARYAGGAWSSVGQGLFHTGTATVYGLAKIGGSLYATGIFTNAGGSVVTRNVARWDGSKWESLGSGIGNEAPINGGRGLTVAAWGNDLFIGGMFETAGVCDAGYLARWNDQLDFSPPSTMRLVNPQMLPGNAFKFRVSATERATYVIEQSADLVSWMPLTTNSAYFLDVTNTAPSAHLQMYRMRRIP